MQPEGLERARLVRSQVGASQQKEWWVQRSAYERGSKWQENRERKSYLAPLPSPGWEAESLACQRGCGLQPRSPKEEKWRGLL